MIKFEYICFGEFNFVLKKTFNNSKTTFQNKLKSDFKLEFYWIGRRFESLNFERWKQRKRLNELIPYNDCFYRNMYRCNIRISDAALQSYMLQNVFLLYFPCQIQFQNFSCCYTIVHVMHVYFKLIFLARYTIRLSGWLTCTWKVFAQVWLDCAAWCGRSDCAKKAWQLDRNDEGGEKKLLFFIPRSS